jgi:hypothetical protein
MRTLVSGAQVQIYADFGGDVDQYQRRGSPQRAMLDDAWGTIEDLRRRLFLVAAGRASAKFAASAEADLLAWTSDDDARRFIRAMVDRDLQAHTNV